MTVQNFLMFVIVGKLLIFFGRKFPLADKIKGLHPVLKQLIECDLCMGFWVWLILAIIWNDPIVLTKFVLADWIITATFTSFLAFLVTIGWQTQFSIVEI